LKATKTSPVLYHIIHGEDTYILKPLQNSKRIVDFQIFAVLKSDFCRGLFLLTTHKVSLIYNNSIGIETNCPEADGVFRRSTPQ